MNRILSIGAIAAIIVQLILAGVTSATQRTAEDPGGRIDAYLSGLVPFGYSGSVIVAKGGKVLLRKGYGLADRERGIPNTPETVSTVGSITKQFTAAAILKLEMQGKLRVEDPITKYFPNVPEDKRGITIHHLLTHSAGFESDYGESDFEAVSRDEIVRRVFGAELRTPPGAEYNYSNAGYSLLGAIVEIVSGTSYEAYLNEHLFKPAGMTQTGYKVPAWEKARVARGYRGDGEAWGTVLERDWAEDGPYWNLRANGGIHSTVDDMYRWHKALEGDTVLSTEARRKLATPYILEGPGADTHYGYGWSIAKTERGTRLVGHNGGNGIFAADFLRFVDEDAVIFIMSNWARIPAPGISHRVGAILFGEQVAAPPRVVELEPKSLGRLTGSYELADGGRVDVSVAGKGLRLALEGQAAFTLLSSGAIGDREAVEALNERTKRIVEAAAKADYGPLSEAFGGGLALSEIEQMEGQVWSGFRDRFGAFSGATVLGTSASGPIMRTVIQLDFERGRTFLRYAWDHGQLRGISFWERAPSDFVFQPAGETEFVSYDVRSGDTSRIRFRLDPSGRVAGLVVAGPDGEVEATRAAKH